MQPLGAPAEMAGKMRESFLYMQRAIGRRPREVVCTE